MTGSWWEGPLATLDTETTGIDVESDRLVTACLDMYGPSNNLDLTLRMVVDPGVPIPKAASDVHGYTAERIAQTPAAVGPVEALEALEQGLEYITEHKMPVVIYNAPYDLTLIDREMRRHLGHGLDLRFPVIDPLVLDKHADPYVRGKNQRRLEPTARRYGVEVGDWHTAEADAFAAMAIARKIGEKFEQTLPHDLKDLWRLQVRAKAGQAAHLQGWFAETDKKNDDGTPIIIDPSWPMTKWEER